LSGSYNNYFRTFDRGTGQDTVAEANYRLYRQENGSLQRGQLCGQPRTEVDLESLDFDAKIMHSAWHPKENIVALAAGNLLYVFEAD
ncbi:UNVERIFIED_CONTAM: Serine/threonine-protein phosphatase 2A 55 kDa regulatory subunit B delta isoform, partial [Eudyptes robustus]